MTNVAINGGGRIGLQFLKHHIRECEIGDCDIDVVLINDPFVEIGRLKYLIQYDTVHGRFDLPIDVCEKSSQVTITGKSKTYKIKLTREREPKNIPCKELGVKLMVECTGVFTSEEKAKQHFDSGVEYVVISAPGSGNMSTFVYGVNHTDFVKSKDKIVSNASCTTNCIAPIVKVIDDTFGVEHCLLTTTHAATSTQNVVDGMSRKDYASGRSVFNNISPASTGAAKAIGKVMPHLNGKIDGNALRVPVPNVSVSDLVFTVKKKTSIDKIMEALNKACKEGPLKNVLGIAEDQTVSSDFMSCEMSAMVIPSSIMLLNDGLMVKIQAFYDNEHGYSKRLLDMTSYIASETK